MSEQRLVDAHEMNANAVPVRSGMSEYEMKKEFQKYINHQTTIDPETLPIVQELRAKLARYEQSGCEPHPELPDRREENQC